MKTKFLGVFVLMFGIVGIANADFFQGWIGSGKYIGGQTPYELLNCAADFNGTANTNYRANFYVAADSINDADLVQCDSALFTTNALGHYSLLFRGSTDAADETRCTIPWCNTPTNSGFWRCRIQVVDGNGNVKATITNIVSIQ